MEEALEVKESHNPIEELESLSILDEEYKPIPQLDGFEISNHGRIRSNGFEVYVCTDKKGYRLIKVCENYYFIHRMVAELFVPNPDRCNVVDHIDNDRGNNVVSNLRWVTTLKNNLNKTPQRNSTGVKGVTYDSKKEKYRVRVSIQNKDIQVGYYSDLETATLVRRLFVNLLYGEEYLHSSEKMDLSEYGMTTLCNNGCQLLDNAVTAKGVIVEFLDSKLN